MQEASPNFSASGMETRLVGISNVLDKIVKSMKEADRLQKSISGNVSKISGSGGVGSGSGSVMPSFGQNISASYSAGGLGAGAGAMTMLGGLGKAAFGMAGGLMSAMPDTTQTINYATQYYNASLFQRRGVNRQMMQKATFGAMSGGMTSVGSDAAVAEYLSGSGMVFSGAKNSTYMQTVRGVSNAAKYMNMENGAAARAIEGMTSGSMSKNMMMNFGIMTSDQKTGKALTQGQIFEQLSQRLTAGRGAASEADVLESYRRGNLGATLKASGLSEDQQQMFVQYMVEKSRGNNMDLSDQASMDKLMKDSKANKGLNPQGAGMEIKSSDTKLMNAAVETYIKAQQDMVPLIKSTNDALEALVPTVGYVNAAFQTLQGSRGTAGVIQGVVAGLEGLSQAISGLVSLIAGLIGMSALKTGVDAIGKLGGGGGNPTGPTSSGRKPASGKPRVAGQPKPGSAAAAAKTGSKAGTTAMKALKVAGKAGGIVGAALTVATIGYESYLYQNNVDGYKDEQDSYWNNYTQNLSNTLKSGGTVGPGYVPQGPSKKGGGYGNWGGDAGVNSFNATAPNTNKKLKFIKPADGPITSPFGNRGVDYGDGGFHNGMDIGAKEGSPIVASADGTVVEVSSQTMGGKYVKIKHANGYTTGYFHQSRQAAVSGATVKQGSVIGYVGMTGTAVTGPHLHFTVQNESGKFIDPASVLSGSYTVSSSGTPASDKSSSSSAGVTGPSTSGVSIDEISDMRAKKASQSIPGMSGKTSSSLANLLIPSSSARSDAASVSSSRTKGMYLPGAPRAKQGDPYVAQDGPVNVHAGEAILTAEQADEWRNSRKGISGGKGGKNNVTINVTVASASESEARRFAKIVKDYLEEDKMISNMGRL